MALYRHRQFSKGPLVFSSSFFRGIFKRMWYISLSIRTCLHDIVCFLEYLISCSYWGWNKNYSLISKLFFPIISLSLSLSLSLVKLGNKELGNGSNVRGPLVFSEFLFLLTWFFDNGIIYYQRKIFFEITYFIKYERSICWD